MHISLHRLSTSLGPGWRKYKGQRHLPSAVPEPLQKFAYPTVGLLVIVFGIGGLLFNAFRKDLKYRPTSKYAKAENE